MRRQQPLMPLKRQLGVGNGACAIGATGASLGGAKNEGKGMVNGAVREIVGVEDGADEDEEEPRKITIMLTGIANYRSCLRTCIVSLSYGSS